MDSIQDFKIDDNTKILCLLLQCGQMNPDEEPIKLLQFFEEIVLEQEDGGWPELKEKYWQLYHLYHKLG